MEGQRFVSKKAVSAYDDVFGGPPRFAAPFADYSEIFGGAGSVCSIPFLDLPPAMDGLEGEPDGACQARRFDYAEVFGGLDFGEFAVPYEELFASSRRRVEVASSDGRLLDDHTILNKVTQDSKISLEDMNEGHMACSEDGHDCFSSNSNHIEQDSEQSNLPYNKTSPDSKDCAMSVTDHITNPPELGSINAMNEGHMTYVEDAHHRLASNSNHSERNAEQSNLSYNRTGSDTKDGAMSRTMHITDPPRIGSIIDRITSLEYQNSYAPITRVVDVKSDAKVESKVSSNLSGDELKTTGNKFPADLEIPASIIDHAPITRALDVKSDLKLENQLPSNLSGDELNTPGNVFGADLQSPASNVDHANLNHHSHPSGSNSIASDDVTTSSVMYISVSDVSLQTQPLRVPPPSRPPPKIHIKKDHPMLKTRTNSGTYHHAQSSPKPSENPEEDSGVMIFKSHARQDAAKDGPFISDVDVDANSAAAAMKEAMELAEARLRSAKELMERKHVNFQNRKKLVHHENRSERKVDQSPVEICNTSVTPKTLTKEDKQIDVIDSKGSTYERTKVTTNISENNCNENTDVALASEFESIKNFKEDKEKSDMGVNSVNLRDGNAAYKKEVVKELDNNVLVASPPQEGINDFENAHVSSSGDEQHEKVQNVHEGQLRVPFTIDKSTTSGRSEENPLSSENHDFQKIDDCKDGNRKTSEAKEFCKSEANLHNFEPIHINSVEDLYSDSAKVAFESGDNEKDLTEANVNCEECVNENNLNACMIHAIPDEEEMNMPFSSSVGEVGEELISGNLIGGSSANSILQGQVECDQKENLEQMDGNRVAIVQETTEELCFQQESSISRKSDAGEVVDNIVKVADEVIEGLKKLQATKTMMYGEPEKSKATEVSCLQDCNEIKEKEVWVEEEKSENMQEAAAAAQVLFSRANSEKQNICQKNHEVRDNEEIGEIHVKPDGSENINLNSVSDTPVSSQLTDLNLQWEKISGTAESAQVTAENFDVVSEKIICNIKNTEEKENEQMERERIWTEIQARKLEKEKEWEREREKDRLAMERETHEARERAFAEAKERADRIAVERVTAEARQRALKEAREKAEKASLTDKSLAEKASREARLRAERAAVERATSEARERAAEKARAEKAAADARERTERSNGSYRDRISRENLTEEHFKARNKDVPSGAQFQSIGPSNNSKGYAYLNSQKAGDAESALRCKARLERHQRTAERVAKALAEKSTRDILAQREQAERNRLSEYLDADVKRWSNGKEGNLRALLSTLQYILGPESGWQPICLTDVITAAAVKKAYRKATLCVHPDKLQQRRATIQQKYICEKVFDLLKEAWNKFNSEER